MNGNLCEEAEALGKVVQELVMDRGGMQLLRRAAQHPAVREDVGRLLDSIGVWELVPQADQMDLEAGAAVCRAVGWFGLPYPVAERLAAGEPGAAAVLVDPGRHGVGMHLDLDLRWSGLDMSGKVWGLEVGSRRVLGTELAPFGVEYQAVQSERPPVPRSAAVLTTLQAWWLLGLLEHAASDTVRYTREREQFGHSLATFQAVAFRQADMALAVRSLEELAKYTLWSIARTNGGCAGLVDAIALRLAALDSAAFVLRGAHQLHGAMGFTDEVDVSWLSRASQGIRRLPLGRHGTNVILTNMLGPAGLGDLGLPESAHSLAPEVPAPAVPADAPATIDRS